LFSFSFNENITARARHKLQPTAAADPEENDVLFTRSYSRRRQHSAILFTLQFLINRLGN